MSRIDMLKELLSQFFLPLALCASALGLLVFWPFSL